jgi:hypothetical protein
VRGVNSCFSFTKYSTRFILHCSCKLSCKPGIESQRP